MASAGGAAGDVDRRQGGPQSRRPLVLEGPRDGAAHRQQAQPRQVGQPHQPCQPGGPRQPRKELPRPARLGLGAVKDDLVGDVGQGRDLRGQGPRRVGRQSEHRQVADQQRAPGAGVQPAVVGAVEDVHLLEADAALAPVGIAARRHLGLGRAVVAALDVKDARRPPAQQVVDRRGEARRPGHVVKEHQVEEARPGEAVGRPVDARLDLGFDRPRVEEAHSFLQRVRSPSARRAASSGPWLPPR